MRLYFFYPNVDNSEIVFYTLDSIKVIGWDNEFSVSFASPDECINYQPSGDVDLDLINESYRPSSFVELQLNGYEDILMGYFPVSDEWKCGEPMIKYLGPRVYFNKVTP